MEFFVVVVVVVAVSSSSFSFFLFVVPFDILVYFETACHQHCLYSNLADSLLPSFIVRFCQLGLLVPILELPRDLPPSAPSQFILKSIDGGVFCKLLLGMFERPLEFSFSYFAF